MNPRRPVAILLAPSRDAISGVTTHLNLLLASDLARDHALIHFQVGSEGRAAESAAACAWRLIVSPLILALRILLANADLVHINTSLNPRAWWRDLIYLAVARLTGARVVYQVHGGDLPREFAALVRIPQAALRAVLRLPHVVVLLASSEYSAYRKFVPDQRVLVVPNGIDVSSYRSPLRTASRSDGPLRLVFVGRLAPQKGLRETLEGLAMARAWGAQATLTVAGGGAEEAPMKALTEKLKLTDAVNFVGPVFDEAKRRLLESSDVLMLPSHYEGLPYSLLEGMAAGVPVIATRVGGVPDVVEHGVHGLFVPLRSPRAIGRAIVRMSRNRAWLTAMGIAGYRRVARSYSVERLAAEFAGLYATLCPAGQPAAGR